MSKWTLFLELAISGRVKQLKKFLILFYKDKKVRPTVHYNTNNNNNNNNNNNTTTTNNNNNKITIIVNAIIMIIINNLQI